MKKAKPSRFDVCLVSPPTRAHNRKPPLALMMLAAYLEREGVPTEIIDIKIHSFSPVSQREEERISREIVRRIRKSRPLLIGITSLCHEVNETIQLAKLFKKNFPKTPIVAGGAHGTFYPESYLFRGSPIDCVVMGEGEITLTEIAQKIKSKEPIDTIAGTAFFRKGEVVCNEWRRLIENLDTLPFPAYEKVDMDFYLKPAIYGIRWLLLSCCYIFTTRGCPAMCRFCVNKNLWKASGQQKIVRLRSIPNVIDEIEMLIKKYRIDALYIFDDSFIINAGRVKDFCTELMKRNIKLTWGCEARVDKITEEIIRMMKEAGCVQIDFGVESGSQECLNRVNKNITIEQIENAFELCKKYGMRTFANFMFNFPDETEEDVQQTFELAERIKATVSAFGIMTPYPGTDIYSELNLALSRKELDIYKSAVYGLADKRFRMAKHKLDLGKLVTDATVRFNSPFNQMNLNALRIYLKSFASSNRKTQYLSSVIDLSGFTITSLIPRALSKNISPYRPKKGKA